MPLEQLEQLLSVIFVVIFAPLALISAFLIGASIFLRRSLSALATKTGVDTFKAAGLVLLIGAVLTVFAVGVILIWAGFILLAAGFFSIKTTITQLATAPS